VTKANPYATSSIDYSAITITHRKIVTMQCNMAAKGLCKPDMYWSAPLATESRGITGLRTPCWIFGLPEKSNVSALSAVDQHVMTTNA
jgi:hypothetical protein